MKDGISFKDESWLRGPSRDGQRGQASSSDLEPGLGSPANSQKHFGEARKLTAKEAKENMDEQQAKEARKMKERERKMALKVGWICED